MSLSIIIPHRGSPLGLWTTVCACEEQLQVSGLDYNYVLVTNGEPLPEGFGLLPALEDSGKLRKHIHSDEPLTPPNARELGADATNAEYLFFFDNHCIPGQHYFLRAVADFEKPEVDMVHSATQFYAGREITYHYEFKLEYNFWAKSALYPHVEHKPYLIGAAGHGGFAVRKSVWDEIGGYGPSDLLVGYGGEEMLFDLKMWRYGKQNWLDPKMVHWHFPGDKGYSRHYSDQYYINLLVSAFVIGGESWLHKVFDSYLNKKHIRYSPKMEWWDIYETAVSRGAEYAKYLDATTKWSLDEVLQKFKSDSVAM